MASIPKIIAGKIKIIKRKILRPKRETRPLPTLLRKTVKKKKK